MNESLRARNAELGASLACAQAELRAATSQLLQHDLRPPTSYGTAAAVAEKGKGKGRRVLRAVGATLLWTAAGLGAVAAAAHTRVARRAAVGLVRAVRERVAGSRGAGSGSRGRAVVDMPLRGSK